MPGFQESRLGSGERVDGSRFGSLCPTDPLRCRSRPESSTHSPAGATLGGKGDLWAFGPRGSFRNSESVQPRLRGPVARHTLSHKPDGVDILVADGPVDRLKSFAGVMS